MHARLPLSALCIALACALAACAVGPDYQAPTPAAPADWTSWHGGPPELAGHAGAAGAPAAQWWRSFGDPALDRLQARALAASPDLQSAALRYAQARTQRRTVAAQRGPQVDAAAAVTRQRQSEDAAANRILDAIAPANRQAVTELLSDPYTLYQAGFDASWELDLWGRVRRAVEAADADVAASAALYDAARLSLVSEVARNYFELRTAQHQARLLRQDIAALQEQLSLIQARARGGLAADLDVARQRTQLAGLQAQLPRWLEQQAQAGNRLGLLLGARPGELGDELAAPEGDGPARPLPDYALGLPSELARRRPDIRAAEARLHQATARIGLTQADLYPSIRLGARFDYESYESGKFGDWGSRTWSIGPSLDLPIFDSGRRRSVVTLRELQQQEAAVAYQQTVLRAWHEVDDALSGYRAEQLQYARLREKAESAAQARAWAQARYLGGLTDYLAVLDAQREDLQARRDLTASDGRLRTRLVVLYKALAGGAETQP
ncbi:efflux transporter outer membrane subunit [Bordetella bronchiseptica]|uniref:Probable outer membrane efflux protein n=1 Tax=Bordetella bronchiseptica 253 TaxID=568707 RepID=A0A0C6P1E4_BORBO|nr:efflux transporter outer membrane subunit [Bordetella bronchiseptica]CCJ52123.1 probable outer membrane efflux protein [Bordetella bronchiseptica 253]